MRSRAVVTLAGVVMMASAGCYSNWDLSPRALGPLNNFHDPGKVELTDTAGDRFTFDRTTQLSFEGPETPFTKFSSIQVAGSTFAGVALEDNHPVTVNLAQVKAVHAKRWSLWKTTALVSGITLAVCVVAVIIIAAAAAGANGGGD